MASRGQGKTPRGSVAAVIEHMREHPDQVTWTIPELAELIGCDIKSVTQRLRCAVINQWLHRFKADGVAVFSLDPEPAEPVPFHATRHIDGDIDLFGLELLENGGSRLSAAAAKQLRALMGAME